jgi:Predicted RNA-binding protein
MERVVEKTGKNVNEAVTAALQELNVPESKVKVEIIEEGSKGLFGIIGSKYAKVRVSYVEEAEVEEDEEVYEDADQDFSAIEKGEAFLNNILEKMGVDAQVTASQKDFGLAYDIRSEDMAIIIGRRGETLDALQYITSLVVNKGQEDYNRVVLNVENYREKREESLQKLAKRLAEKVVRYRRDITLESMNPYERRIIHATLQNYRNVKTYSIGEEPSRKVVIAYKKD